MSAQPPFLDVRSFVREEEDRTEADRESPALSRSPFVSLYELEEGGGVIDPEAEVRDSISAGMEDPETVGYQAERLLNQHFAPLIAEAEALHPISYLRLLSSGAKRRLAIC